MKEQGLQARWWDWRRVDWGKEERAALAGSGGAEGSLIA
jgi:hypothetical protein